MKVIMDKRIAELLEIYQKDPSSFKNSTVKDLIQERQNMALKEQRFVDEMKVMQDEISRKLSEKGNELMKLRGAVEYLEDKILEELAKNTASK